MFFFLLDCFYVNPAIFGDFFSYFRRFPAILDVFLAIFDFLWRFLNCSCNILQVFLTIEFCKKCLRFPLDVHKCVHASLIIRMGYLFRAKGPISRA